MLKAKFRDRFPHLTESPDPGRMLWAVSVPLTPSVKPTSEDIDERFADISEGERQKCCGQKRLSYTGLNKQRSRAGHPG
jgi:hypothetical protein